MRSTLLSFTSLCLVSSSLATPRETITTSLGQVTGQVLDKAVRWTLPYATAARFQDPVAIRSFSGYNASNLALACAQDREPGLASNSEDCLYINVYAPLGAPVGRLPVFIWVHGGTFVSGSNNAPGIDGSVLASSKNIIVITVSYRLGLLGLLHSSDLGIGNLAMKDLVLALGLISREIVYFGGEKAAVTLAGQSSGAEMIKTLLAMDSPLFSKAILHSPALNYKDSSVAVGDAVGSLALGDLNCASLACLQSLSVAQILATQRKLFDPSSNIFAYGLVPGVSMAEPLRPVIDKLIPFDFGEVAAGKRSWKHPKSIIITSVKDEACKTINDVSEYVLPAAYFEPIIHQFIPDSRADTIIASGLYSPNNSQFSGSADATRNALSALGADYIWNCPIQQFAVNLTQSNPNTPKIWLGQFMLGQYYSTNLGTTEDYFCLGKVAHEDDIYAVFGTEFSPRTFNQKRVSQEVIDRWIAFASTGNPNTRKLKNVWNPVNSGNLNLLLLGANSDGSSSIVNRRAGDRCGMGLWGNTVPFDEQLV